MNIVSENHADSLGNLAGPAPDGLFLAAIGEGLRANFHSEYATMPEEMLALIRSLDGQIEGYGQSHVFDAHGGRA